MDEKTESLRDIFLGVADEGSVTEEQEASRGSLSRDDSRTDERLAEVVAEMRETLGFRTALDDGTLVRVVRGYYDDESDSDIAAAIDADRRVVFRARLDLHLLRERDTDAPFELSRLRRLLNEGYSPPEIAERLEVSESTVRRYRQVVEAQRAARQVSDRFRAAFADALPDAVLAERMTEDMRQSGLEDATEGMETNTSL